MEREEQWQEQGGGELGTDGGPSGADIDGPNESAPGAGDEEKEFPGGGEEAGGDDAA